MAQDDDDVVEVLEDALPVVASVAVIVTAPLVVAPQEVVID